MFFFCLDEKFNTFSATDSTRSSARSKQFSEGFNPPERKDIVVIDNSDLILKVNPTESPFRSQQNLKSASNQAISVKDEMDNIAYIDSLLEGPKRDDLNMSKCIFYILLFLKI
jgi:hypothetical protein